MADILDASNRLAEELDARLPAGTRAAPISDPDPLLNAAFRLANAPCPLLPPQVMERIQAQVVAAHKRQFPRANSRLHVYSFSRYLAVASVVMVLFFAGFIPTMASSVPGEILYPVKTALENFELMLATSNETQANVYLTHAERRTAEANTLLTRGTFDETLITGALDSLIDSAVIVERGYNLPNLAELQIRAAGVNASLDSVLSEAETRQLAPTSTIAMLHDSLDSARENGDALLLETTAPAEVTPEVVEMESPAATPTNTPTATLTPMAAATDLPSATPSATSTFTEIPTVTPSATATPEVTIEATAEITAEVTESVEITPSITAIIRASQAVNVRNGPGLQYAVITTLPPNASVPLLGWSQDGAWLNILLEDGRKGWIASSLSNLYDLAPANSGAQLNNGGQDNNGGQGAGNDFGCEHPGNFCNAPGQNITPPGQGGDNPGQGSDEGQGQGGKP